MVEEPEEDEQEKSDSNAIKRSEPPLKPAMPSKENRPRKPLSKPNPAEIDLELKGIHDKMKKRHLGK